MSLARYLVDTSALVRLLRGAHVRERWEHQITVGLIAICPLVELELLYSARSMAVRDELIALLRATFSWVLMPDAVFDRASEIQAGLTARGTHRSAGAVDLLIAAAAELHALVLLHYDRDFELVSEVTGQPTRWLVVPGSVP